VLTHRARVARWERNRQRGNPVCLGVGAEQVRSWMRAVKLAVMLGMSALFLRLPIVNCPMRVRFLWMSAPLLYIAATYNSTAVAQPRMEGPSTQEISLA
jgi:hypothetical protein